MVPLRALAESFRAEVQFSPEDQRVILTGGGKRVELKVGDPQSGAVIRDGRTYVPLRAAEALGASVGFDNGTITVTVMP